MQEDKEKSLNYSSKKVEIIGISGNFEFICIFTFCNTSVNTKDIVAVIILIISPGRIPVMENQILYVQYNIRLPAGQ